MVYTTDRAFSNSVTYGQNRAIQPIFEKDSSMSEGACALSSFQKTQKPQATSGARVGHQSRGFIMDAFAKLSPLCEYSLLWG